MNAQFLNTKAGQYIALGGAAIAALVFVVWYGKRQVIAAANVAGGVVSGNNALTQNQTDASGNPVTAYQGAGIAGTLGAAANSASGGTLASAGESIGGWIYDLLNSDTTVAGK